jgi:hypothetical protein
MNTSKERIDEVLNQYLTKEQIESSDEILFTRDAVHEAIAELMEEKEEIILRPKLRTCSNCGNYAIYENGCELCGMSRLKGWIPTSMTLPMAKYYFQKHDENCYTLDYHKEYMKENGIDTMEVYEAKQETGTGYFYCTESQESYETKDFWGVSNCGKECTTYKPRNGKNGRCKNHQNTYEQTDKVKILTIKNK